MLKGTSLTWLVGLFAALSLFVIILEWQIVQGMSADDRIRSGSSFPARYANIIKNASASAAHKLKEAQVSVKRTADGFLHSKKLTSVSELITVSSNSTTTPQLPSFPTPPEIRHHACRHRQYGVSAMPTVTMVIPYLNETWEQISKTLGSILSFTPPELLDEILMVDDGNAPEWAHHRELLEVHPKVRVHRNDKRQGLIKAKVTGAELVSSPVIMFFEPHCVVGRQWLEPLLQRMMEGGHRTVVMPTLDIIPENDFSEYKTASYHIGGFDWSLTFNWMVTIQQRNKSYRLPDSYPTPAMSGGVYAIWRDYWFESGTYDINMTEWGGEHIEMSLRTWRCGGNIQVVPCSRIGHVFRAKNPYVVHPVQVVRNEKRAALVWLDDRLEDFYKKVPQARRLDAGDVTERLKLKKKLNCHSMQWYIDNVYPELLTKQPRAR